MKGIAGLAAGAVGVAIFAGAGALDDNTTRDESGAIVEAGGLGAFAMRVGDCFDEPDGTEVVSVAGLPCSEPHDGEVYALWDLPYDEYPVIEDEMYEDASLGCLDRFEGYVGTTYQESVFEVGYFTPTRDSWLQGDREILCYAFDYRGLKLTSVVRDSGR